MRHYIGYKIMVSNGADYDYYYALVLHSHLKPSEINVCLFVQSTTDEQYPNIGIGYHDLQKSLQHYASGVIEIQLDTQKSEPTVIKEELNRIYGGMFSISIEEIPVEKIR